MIARPFRGRGASLILLVLFVFTPSGNSWDISLIGPPGGHFKSIACLGDGLLLAGSFNGRLFISNNHGELWSEITPVHLKPEMVVEQIVFQKRLQQVYIAVRDLKSGFLLRCDRQNLAQNEYQWDTILPVVPVRSVAVSETDPPRIYVGTDERLYYSDDGGGHWSISLFQFPDPQIESIVLDPEHSEMIYAGTWQRAFKSLNNGKNWNPIHTGMAPDSDVFCMMFDRKGNLFAGTCGFAYVSRNRGGNWNKLQAGFKGKRIHCLDMNLEGVMIAGADSGLYRLNESGKAWESLIPDIVIHDTAVDERGRVFCATEGEGILRCDGPGKIAAVNNGLFASSPLKIQITREGVINTGLIHQNSAGGFWSMTDGLWRQIPYKFNDNNIWDFVSTTDFLAVGTSSGLYIVRSGSTGPRIDRFLDGKLIHALHYSVAGDRLYIGAIDGMYLADVGRKTIEPVPFFKRRNVLCLFETSSSGRIYAGCDDGLFMYSSTYKIWIKADLKIDSCRVNRICGNPDESAVFIASDSGIFYTLDHGISFARSDKNLSTVSCTDLCLQNNILYALMANNTIYSRHIKDLGWSLIARIPYPAWSIGVFHETDRLFLGTKGFGIIQVPISRS